MTETLDALVDRLLASDLSSVAVETLCDQLRPHIAGRRMRAPRFAPGMSLFRGRMVGNALNVSELSYPPAERAPLGRANSEGTPRFYACTARAGVFFELPISAGETILVSKWRTATSMFLNHLGYHAEVFKNLGSTRALASFDGKTTPFGGFEDAEPTFAALSRLFVRQVRADDALSYKVSSAAAQCMMGGPFAGLLYPSVAMGANADNVALLPGWVDVNLRFVGVESILIKAVRERQVEIHVVDYATADQLGMLTWKGRGPKWVVERQGEELSMSSANGVWVARDSASREVDPQ